MKLTVFSSGSKGNCSLLKSEKLNILIDVGISKKSIVDNLEESGLTLEDIDQVYITHEHIDHIKSFSTILRIRTIKIFITKGTLDYIYSANYRQNKNIDCGLINARLEDKTIVILDRNDGEIIYNSHEFESLNVSVLPTFHDAKEPVGFIFEENNRSLVYITDTGYIHKDVLPLIYNKNCYLLESNHDPEILMASERPYPLKMRILSDHGHLSNEDSMYTLVKSIGENTKTILHAHVSEECNLSQIIELTRSNIFGLYDIDESKYNFVILQARRAEEITV